MTLVIKATTPQEVLVAVREWLIERAKSHEKFVDEHKRRLAHPKREIVRLLDHAVALRNAEASLRDSFILTGGHACELCGGSGIMPETGWPKPSVRYVSTEEGERLGVSERYRKDGGDDG